jgi:hypothetical protein
MAGPAGIPAPPRGGADGAGARLLPRMFESLRGAGAAGGIADRG